ncbi:hypothetical protein Hhis01_00994 [Haloarcula hispanica]
MLILTRFKGAHTFIKGMRYLDTADAPCGKGETGAFGMLMKIINPFLNCENNVLMDRNYWTEQY